MTLCSRGSKSQTRRQTPGASSSSICAVTDSPVETKVSRIRSGMDFLRQGHKPHPEQAFAVGCFDVVLADEIKRSVVAYPVNGQTGGNSVHVCSAAQRERRLVARNEDSGTRVEGECTRARSARVDVLNQCRLAGFLID